eukprot:1270495-Rhodomonas_salina.1
MGCADRLSRAREPEPLLVARPGNVRLSVWAASDAAVLTQSLEPKRNKQHVAYLLYKKDPALDRNKRRDKVIEILHAKH